MQAFFPVYVVAVVVAGGTPVEVPPVLKQPLQRLAVLPYDTPVPITMLQKLWQLVSVQQCATLAPQSSHMLT